MGSEFIGDTSLAKCISLLRQGFVKLGIKETPIVTVPKVGYRLIDDCVFIESQPQSGATIPLTPVSDQVPLDNSSVAASIASSHESIPKPTSPAHQQIRSRRNRLCYFTTGCLLFASALLALLRCTIGALAISTQSTDSMNSGLVRFKCSKSLKWR